MRFYFLSSDRNLLLPASQGGCGVTEEELQEIKTWQNDMTYQFEFHLENHGPYVYVFPDGRRAGQRDMPRYYFGGGRVGKFDNEGSLSASIQSDVKAVVDANRDLFATMHGRFYGTGGVAKKTVEVGPKPAVAYFTCINNRCGGRDQIIAVKFPSEVTMRRLIKVSNVGGIRSSEIPVIPCTRTTCGVAMDLVEFGSATVLAPKETIEFKG